MTDRQASGSADDPDQRVEDGDSPAARDWTFAGVTLDVFWPVLAVVLVVAVVFVASVANNSMDSVGAVANAAVPSPKPTGDREVTTLTIVQVSSHATRPAAQAAARRLIKRGFQSKVLVSDNFRPLNPGYFVVFVGPYEASPTGRAEARRVQAKLPGTLVREVRSR